MSRIDFKKCLNEEQYAAVTAPLERPALVLAGAGSGKTRTLTYRVAYLLEQGVPSYHILLLTFTNKAAREMLERVEALTGCPGTDFWGGTFHHIGQKLLRSHADKVGLDRSFTILDQNDSEGIMGETMRHIDPQWSRSKERPKPRLVMEMLSYSRNVQSPFAEVVEERYPQYKDFLPSLLAFEKGYEERKRAQQAVDYDDLLCLWLKLMREHTDVAQACSDKFKYILVDEYQDTNPLQEGILRLLASHQRIMVVGDDAQCIYTWRGADVSNILGFPSRHNNAEVYKIQTNYRSTPEVLNFANAILEHRNQEESFSKKLKAVRLSKNKPMFLAVADSRKQAQFIVRRVQALMQEGVGLDDISVLYRAHYQSMDLQMELSRANIPYQITSGVRFFEQAHIKDVIAQLRFVLNPQDGAAFQRFMVLLPKVGPRTALRLMSLAQAEAQRLGISTIQALAQEKVASKLPQEAQEDFETLASVLQQVESHLRPTVQSSALVDLFNYKTQDSKVEQEIMETPQLVQLVIDGWYGDFLRNLHPNWQSRRDDLDGLVAFSDRYDHLDEFLAQLALLGSEMTQADASQEEQRLRLTTVHQAKGLEFSHVFLIGLADGLFPLKRAIDAGDVEEERRLFYVAVTRSKEALYMLYPAVSGVGKNGYVARNTPSRFLREVPEELYEAVALSSRKPLGAYS